MFGGNNEALIAEAVKAVNWRPVLHGPVVAQGSALGEHVTHEGECIVLGKRIGCMKLSSGEVVFNADDVEREFLGED